MKRFERDVGCQRNALSNRRDSGMYPLVRRLSAELTASAGNDGGARCVCRPFLDQPLGDRFLPALERAFRRHKRAVDKDEKTADFLLTARRDKAMKASSVLEKVTMDKSGANKAAMDEINVRCETPIIVRPVKYLSNIVEQDHRAVKRITEPMLKFKSFRSTKSALADIELMHMICKGQLLLEDCIGLSFADPFYELAGRIRLV